jgi:hypothetical protein
MMSKSLKESKFKAQLMHRTLRNRLPKNIDGRGLYHSLFLYLYYR